MARLSLSLSSAGIWLSRSGRSGASPVWRPVISTARTSSVRSSIPRWVLRQTRRMRTLCLRTFQSLLPSAAQQAHSKDAVEGGLRIRCHTLPGKVSRSDVPRGGKQQQRPDLAPIRDLHGQCLPTRLSVLKAGIVWSGSDSRSKFSTPPVVCLNALPVSGSSASLRA